MPNKRPILFAVPFVATLVVVISAVMHKQDPIYQGKRLSGWLDQFGKNHWMHRFSDLDEDAQAAIRHFGSNAIPIYLKDIATHPSWIRLLEIKYVPQRWRAPLHIPYPMTYEKELDETRTWGAYGIVALGPDAKSAIPALINLLKDKDADVRGTAVFALSSLGPVARQALPSLVNCLKDTDSGIRLSAILSLGEIHREPEWTVPLLIECLGNNDFLMRNYALMSLYQFKAEAKPAFPILLKLINDPNAAIRIKATNVLIAIDPEAAAKVGVRYQ